MWILKNAERKDFSAVYLLKTELFFGDVAQKKCIFAE